MARLVSLLRHRASAALAVSALAAGAWRGAVSGPAQEAPRCRVRGSHEWLASRASPLDSATIAVGPAVARVCYSRPRARGRSVYDSLAPFGKAWRTGANEATILELTVPAVVAGVRLAAGRHAVLTVPHPTAWTVLFHTFTTPDSPFDDPGRVYATLREVGRGTMPAEAVQPPVEAFTVRAVSDSSERAFLLEWGALRARMPVEFPR